MNPLFVQLKAVRQSIISSAFANHALSRTPTSHDDPFEVYHYDDPPADHSVLHNIEREVMQKIDSEANLLQMREIVQQLQEEEYILDQHLQMERMEVDAVNLLLERIQTLHQGPKDIIRMPTPKVSVSQQTNLTQTKEQGTFTAAAPTKPSKNPSIHDAYSIKIDLKDQNRQAPANPARPKAEQQIPNKTIKRVKTQKQSTSMQETLKTEFAYLEHLKSNKSSRAYKQQKKRLKFLMEQFWKSALPHADQEQFGKETQ